MYWDVVELMHAPLADGVLLLAMRFTGERLVDVLASLGLVAAVEIEAF